MKTIAVIRKPLDGTVASNVLKHGCGGLNIGASRIGTVGRWPGNIILNHLEGCVRDGEKFVRSDGHFPERQGSNPGAHGKMGKGWSGSVAPERHMGEAGSEAIANWICEGGCPVAELDEQSGIGASRYFKQLHGKLVPYLRDLIAPPEGSVEVVALDFVEPDGDDRSLHGIIVLGTPTPEQCKDLFRILKPGAHVLLIAPEDEPTGHTGMCRMEDTGFEIRDTILLLLEDTGFWYVPKPSRTEREAGCHGITKKQQDESRKPGNPGGDNPRNRGLKERGNSHPTVKPFGIMQALMEGQEGPVVDPFMGSGSTGIAAIHTGHDFIGIEREDEYLRIADARVRHWADSQWRGRMTEVASDLEQEKAPEPEAMDLDALFGLGGSQ